MHELNQTEEIHLMQLNKRIRNKANNEKKKKTKAIFD
jgi:hypothetical protein